VVLLIAVPYPKERIMSGLLRLVISLLLISTLTACSLTEMQVVKTHTFGTATAEIGKFGESEFINIRNDIIEMNKALVAIDNKKKAKSLQFDRPVSAVATAKRVAAAKALKRYGELLVKLVDEDRTEGLKEAASALVSNTSAALGKEFSDEKKGIISDVIVGFGSFWVEAKKATVAKSLILEYEEPVAKLADLMGKDFSLEAGAMGYLKAYTVTAKRLQNATIRLVNAGAKYSVLERERAVNALALAKKALNHAQSINANSTMAIAKLKKANSELVSVMQGNEYSADDVKSYAKQVQELVAMYQVLSGQ
jgi:hypothetical protein